jgi:hypothetical protein
MIHARSKFENNNQLAAAAAVLGDDTAVAAGVKQDKCYQNYGFFIQRSNPVGFWNRPW